MPKPVRFTRGGVTNAAPNTTLWDFGSMDPTKYHTYFNDFDHFGGATDWTLTEVGAGGSTALTDVDGGAIILTCDAGASDVQYAQKIGEGFLLEAGKQAWFKIRLKMSHATTADVVAGLQITDTTPLDATDGIYFLKPAAGTSWSLVCRLDATTGSTSVSSIATAVADTFMSLGWHYDGKSAIKYFINDVHTGTLATSASYLPNTELTVSFGVLGASQTCTVDYVFASKER
jgi:hypothetical protein